MPRGWACLNSSSCPCTRCLVRPTSSRTLVMLSTKPRTSSEPSSEFHTACAGVLNPMQKARPSRMLQYLAASGMRMSLMAIFPLDFTSSPTNPCTNRGCQTCCSFPRSFYIVSSSVCVLPRAVQPVNGQPRCSVRFACITAENERPDPSAFEQNRCALLRPCVCHPGSVTGPILRGTLEKHRHSTCGTAACCRRCARSVRVATQSRGRGGIGVRIHTPRRSVSGCRVQ